MTGYFAQLFSVTHDRTIDSLFPLAACLASSDTTDTTRVNSQGGGFQVNNNSIPPNLVLICVVSTIGYHLQVLRGNQGQWQQFILF